MHDFLRVKNDFLPRAAKRRQLKIPNAIKGEQKKY